MQLVMKSSSSSSSSSSQSAGSRRDHSTRMEKFHRLHPRSSPPPPPGLHRKDTKKHHHRHGHHGGRSPSPHHRRHLDVHRPRHDSFPPLPLVCALRCKADKLRVKNPKHFKKVGKIHRKLIKACKRHKGTAHLLHMYNVCPGAPHHPGCCLHNPNPNPKLRMMEDVNLAELKHHVPPCHHEARFGHHGRHGRPHRHGRHYPHVRSVIRCGSAPPMLLARDEAKDTQAEPAIEAGMVPPVSDNMLLDVERGPEVN